MDGVMITQRGQKLAVENKDSVYCPFTQNAKLETFLEDLFDMRIAQSSVRRQIQDYVKCIETHYTDIINKLRGKVKKLTFEVQKSRGKNAIEKDKRSELEEVLIEAIDKTRLQIFKRRLAQDKITRDKKMIKKVQLLGTELQSHGVQNTPQRTDGFASIEPTLVKLNDFINSKIKLQDFSPQDKQNLVELFVTH